MRLLTATLILITFSLYAQEGNYKLDVITEYSKAQKELDEGDISNAYSLFQSCIVLDSSCIEAYLSLSIIDYKRGNYKSSLKFASLGKKLDPYNSNTNGIMGKSLYAIEHYAEAIKSLKLAVSLNDKSIEYIYYLAQAYQKLAQYEDALYYYDRALDLSPEEEKIWNSRGLLFMEMENYNKAKSDFFFATKLNPKTIGFSINLIHSLYKINEIEEAFDLTSKTIPKATKIEQSELYSLQGYAYLRSDNSIAADSCFKLSLISNPTEASALVGQAVINIEQENFTSAIDNCNAALTSHPEIASAYLNRGIAYEMIRDTKSACTDWEQAFFLGSTKAIEYLNSPVCNE